MQIRSFEPSDLPVVVDLGVRAWAPVFESIKGAMDDDVYDAFFPDWRSQQAEAIEKACTAPEYTAWVALIDGVPVGFASAKEHLDSPMGEIHMVAVDPAFQRRGVARALTVTAMDWMRSKGIKVAMVETGGDPGHEPARRTYEATGFRLFPVARYFAKL